MLVLRTIQDKLPRQQGDLPTQKIMMVIFEMAFYSTFYYLELGNSIIVLNRLFYTFAVLHKHGFVKK